MTVDKLQEKLGLTYLCGQDIASTKEIDGCYCGDLLSWVMSRAEEGDAWLTVMGNVNAVAVAVLADCACIILTENAALDDEAKQKATEQNVCFMKSDKNTYQLACEISKLI